MMTRHVAPDQCAKLKVSCKEDILRKTKHVAIWKKVVKMIHLEDDECDIL